MVGKLARASSNAEALRLAHVAKQKLREAARVDPKTLRKPMTMLTRSRPNRVDRAFAYLDNKDMLY